MSIHETNFAPDAERTKAQNAMRKWRDRAQAAERRVAERMDALRAAAYRSGSEEGHAKAVAAVSEQLRALAAEYRGNPVLEAVAAEVDRVASDVLGVKSMFQDAPEARSTIAQIIDRVSDETGIHRAHITGPLRKAPYAEARHEAMRRAYATGRFSLTQIGTVFKRDHTSVLHGIRKATERLDQ